MKRYDEKILNKLIDRYEGSLLYSGKNQLNISITVPMQKSIIPEYFDEASMQYDVIHEQLEALEEKGYIRLVWKNKKKGHILDKCELVVERADEVYRVLRRKPRDQKEQEIIRIGEKYLTQATVLDQFLKWVITRLKAGESIKKYVDTDNPAAFDRLCILIWKILTNEEECFLRQFSISCFHDSKIAEKEIEKAVHIIAEFSGNSRFDGLTTDEILEEYNIYRNPSWVMLKGSGKFVCQRNGMKSEISLETFPGGIGVSNQDIEEINWSQRIKPDRIITIENLTSFHQWNCKTSAKELCIYLGGYHNRVKRQFLIKLCEAYPEAEYCHFGDMDCGGFRIWKDLCLKTGIEFHPLLMDRETYLKYLEFGRELTELDRKTLVNMMEESFFVMQKGLFELMLERGKKIEQECVEPFLATQNSRAALREQSLTMLLLDLKKAEERADKEGWIDVDDLERELGI